MFRKKREAQANERPLGAGAAKSVELSEEWPFHDASGFVVLDFETTGTSPARHRVLEVAMIKLDSRGFPVSYWHSLIHPEGPVEATHIHGITDQEVEGAPRFSVIAEEVVRRLKGHVLVGHNVSFDRQFLKMELTRAGIPFPEAMPDVCTYRYAREFLPGLDDYKLLTCASALGLQSAGVHRALGDASMAAGLLHAFLNSGRTKKAHAELSSKVSLASSVDWPEERIDPKNRVGAAVRAGYLPPRPPKRKSPSLIHAVSQLEVDDFLPESSTQSAMTFADLLLTVLKDGQVDDDEVEALDELATSLGLEKSTVDEIKGSLLLWTARQAWQDDKVTNIEKAELRTLSELLSLSAAQAKKALDEIELARSQELGRETVALPIDWGLGEPLRIGDRVVFTGCYDNDRFGMEERAARAGLKVTGSVSKKTTLLVSDGSIDGLKDKAASEFGTRRVSPADFELMLKFIQPAVTR